MFGIGYFPYDFSNTLVNAFAPVGNFKAEQGFDAHDTCLPARWLRRSASLQRVGPTNGANTSVWTGGLQARAAF